MIDGIKKAELIDETLTTHLLNLGKTYLETLKKLEFTNHGNREESIARAVSYIGELMTSNGKGCEFLKYFQFSR